MFRQQKPRSESHPRQTVPGGRGLHTWRRRATRHDPHSRPHFANYAAQNMMERDSKLLDLSGPRIALLPRIGDHLLLIPRFRLTKSKPKPTASLPTPDSRESRGAVAITVVWMLLALSCLAAQVVALATWLVARAAGVPDGRPNALLLVPQTLTLVAVLTGLLILIVTPIAYRVRRTRPPIAVTIAAVVIAIAPLIAVAVIATLNVEL